MSEAAGFSARPATSPAWDQVGTNPGLQQGKLTSVYGNDDILFVTINSPK